MNNENMITQTQNIETIFGVVHRENIFNILL